MSLAPGTRLGPYEILAPIGAGGMGEVYKANDTRLERTVAVKVLPAHLSQDVELKARLVREARAISSLSHPHICALYDVGEKEGVDYLVMEYLEGETLADRVTKGPLTTEVVLRYGIEISEALDKAHRHGVVHRDLKPGNVMLTKSGVKLLDFGLAKLHATDSESALSYLPTRVASKPLTEKGTILGTFQYMSPEQLEGKEADARSDIFALGAVLHEMATGKKAFSGASQASLIAAILSSEPPPISSIQKMAPPALDRLVKTCLAKDPDERWQSAHDVAAELRWIGEGGSQVGAPAVVASRRKGRERLAWFISCVLLVWAVVVTLGYLRRAPLPALPMRFTIPPLPNTIHDSIESPVAISRDGRRIAFTAFDVEGRSALWVRALDTLEGRRLEGTEGAYDAFWSPDGRSLAFGGGNKLVRIDLEAGTRQPICEMVDGRGGSWGRDGTILFTTAGGRAPIFRVPASGGAPSAVTSLDPAYHETGHWRPSFLPDGRHFLFLARSSVPKETTLCVGALGSKNVVRLAPLDVGAVYEPPGYLLYVRDRILMARPFDLDRLQFTGEARVVARDVDSAAPWGSAAFSASDAGVLVFQRGASIERRLEWFDRSGKSLGTLGPIAPYKGNPRVSSDGKRIAVTRTDPETRSGDIWLLDAARGVGTRITFENFQEQHPVFSPDGLRVAYTSNREGVGNVWARSSTGSGPEERLVKSDLWTTPDDWSRDGKYLLYQVFNGSAKEDLWVLPLTGERKAFPLLATPFDEHQARFAPSSRYFAYTSNETGRDEVFVQPMPPNGEKWQVSLEGGEQPHWSVDGKELVYYSEQKHGWKSAPIRPGPRFDAGTPVGLFEVRSVWGADLSPDGRFLINTPDPSASLVPIDVIVNWSAGLSR